jgi:hypothetical protein
MPHPSPTERSFVLVRDCSGLAPALRHRPTPLRLTLTHCLSMLEGRIF